MCLCERADEALPGFLFHPEITVKAGDSVFRLHYSQDCHLIIRDGITAVIYGRLLSGLTSSAVLPLYDKYGTSMGSHLSGFYAILIIDPKAGRAVIISDKVSSKPLFYTEKAGRWTVSTSFIHLARHLQVDPTLDPAGVVWYMTNGVIHNNHTLFREISRLERATLYCGNSVSFSAKEFWRFHFLDEPYSRDERALTVRMKDVIASSITDCIGLEDAIYLSLSGGYDSSGILAMLRYILEKDDIKAFSYGLGQSQPGSDPEMARELAELAGYPFELISSYEHDFRNNIEFNVFWATASQIIAMRSLAGSNSGQNSEITGRFACLATTSLPMDVTRS
jgi:asparagine synthetase B (glutamine-hydrolysing)